ncbi:hypothetical protein OHA21_47085 [Actinoplanes sp. NBC_00393]|uniref:hypothetical protein n=1 Tax=Actinoplanes sp. NBC_00393 TaxID=2975953 RepID=UPI002E1DDC0B
MNTATLTAAAWICGRCRHTTTPDQGFGYSRELDLSTPEPVPADVELHFFTGRTSARRAAA